VVLYGTDESDRLQVADYLQQRGFRQLYQFDFADWARDESRPLLRYPNYHLLVPPSIVKQLLDGQIPETFEKNATPKFVEVSWGGEEASYLKGHVPHSFHVNTDHFEPPPMWYLGDADTLRKFAERYGFQPDDTVILSGADPTAAYRLAIVLRYMGIADVRILNGGFAAWKAAGYPVETNSTAPTPAKWKGPQIPGRPELILSTRQVIRRRQQDADFTLVDTRTWAEFIGETSGYSYHRSKGRIPGSVYGQADDRSDDSLTAYRNIDDTMRNADEIRALWQRAGIDSQNHLSFLCGGGWRAAEVLTFAHVMGINNSSLYSDGWIGWSNAGHPIER
jgi:thiosulfate/3-mercaptopyruvate sulfurtransferase